MEVKDVRPLQLARDEVDCLAPALSLTRRGFVKTSLGAGRAAAVPYTEAVAISVEPAPKAAAKKSEKKAK